MLFCSRAAGVDSMSLTYVKPYCRIAPYLVGMVLGYLLVHAKDWKLRTKVTPFCHPKGLCLYFMVR